MSREIKLHLESNGHNEEHPASETRPSESTEIIILESLGTTPEPLVIVVPPVENVREEEETSPLQVVPISSDEEDEQGSATVTPVVLIISSDEEDVQTPTPTNVLRVPSVWRARSRRVGRTLLNGSPGNNRSRPY